MIVLPLVDFALRSSVFGLFPFVCLLMAFSPITFSLLYLLSIRNRYKLKLRASDFINRTSSIGWTDVAYSLLNRVQLSELLTDEIQVHVKPFCQAHKLDLNHVLLGYTELIVRRLLVKNPIHIDYNRDSVTNFLFCLFS